MTNRDQASLEEDLRWYQSEYDRAQRLFDAAQAELDAALSRLAEAGDRLGAARHRRIAATPKVRQHRPTSDGQPREDER